MLASRLVPQPERSAPARAWRKAASAAVALVAISAVVGYAVWTLKPSPTPQVARFRHDDLRGECVDALGHRSRRGDHTGRVADRVWRQQSVARTRARPTRADRSDGFGGPSGFGNPRGIFISPDGQWVGFFTGPAMQKVAITGGPAVRIDDDRWATARCDVGAGSRPSSSRPSNREPACSASRCRRRAHRAHAT